MSASTPPDARQRWRIVYRRTAEAPDLPQRDQLAAWESALAVSGLPFVTVDGGPTRPRLVFGAALPAGVTAEADLVDAFLVERRPIADVRVRLAGSMPSGHDLVDLHDVWLGAPSLAGSVAAADYLVELAEDPAVDRAALVHAASALLASPALPRTRAKGDREVGYDLRPLLADIEVGPGAPGRPLAIRVRTRIHPERGVGRPEEVVAALGDLLGAPLAITSLARERLWLADELGEGS